MSDLVLRDGTQSLLGHQEGLLITFLVTPCGKPKRRLLALSPLPFPFLVPINCVHESHPLGLP